VRNPERQRDPERERERKRKRKRKRERERERDPERPRETQRERERETQREGDPERERERLYSRLGREHGVEDAPPPVLVLEQEDILDNGRQTGLGQGAVQTGLHEGRPFPLQRPLAAHILLESTDGPQGSVDFTIAVDV